MIYFIKLMITFFQGNEEPGGFAELPKCGFVTQFLVAQILESRVQISLKPEFLRLSFDNFFTWTTNSSHPSLVAPDQPIGCDKKSTSLYQPFRYKNKTDRDIGHAKMQSADRADCVLFASRISTIRARETLTRPITQSTSIGIQFHQYYAVIFNLRKKLPFLACKILFYASVDVKWKSKNFAGNRFLTG